MHGKSRERSSPPGAPVKVQLNTMYETIFFFCVVGFCGLFVPSYTSEYQVQELEG